jgi:hypothetical protein
VWNLSREGLGRSTWERWRIAVLLFWRLKRNWVSNKKEP